MTTKRRPAKAKDAASTAPSVQIAEKFRRICDEIQSLAECARETAAFHALEALESENQDAAEQRENAIRMAGVATGHNRALEVIRSHMVHA